MLSNTEHQNKTKQLLNIKRKTTQIIKTRSICLTYAIMSGNDFSLWEDDFWATSSERAGVKASFSVRNLFSSSLDQMDLSAKPLIKESLMTYPFLWSSALTAANWQSFDKSFNPLWPKTHICVYFLFHLFSCLGLI